MIEKITIDNLSESGVNISVQKYIKIDNKMYEIGDMYRVSYSNSKLGRVEIRENLTEPYLSAVMAVWGDKPVVSQESVL